MSTPAKDWLGYEWKLYEKSVAGGLYVIGVDSAMGNAGDYSAKNPTYSCTRGPNIILKMDQSSQPNQKPHKSSKTTSHYRR